MNLAIITLWKEYPIRAKNIIHD